MDLTARLDGVGRRWRVATSAGVGTFLLTVGTAAAQNASNASNATNATGADITASDLCGNQLVTAMDGLITLLAAIGPIVGALVAMVAMLVLATTQNPRKKKKWIETRNDAIKYGVGILFVGAIINLLVKVTSPEIASCVSVLG